MAHLKETRLVSGELQREASEKGFKKGQMQEENLTAFKSSIEVLK